MVVLSVFLDVCRLFGVVQSSYVIVLSLKKMYFLLSYGLVFLLVVLEQFRASVGLLMCQFLPLYC